MVLASIAAVLVQPVAFALLKAVLMVISLLGGATMSEGALPRLLQQLVLISFYVIVVAAAFVAVLGVPLFLALKRMGRLGWRSVLAAGFLAAAIPLALFSFPLWRDSPGFSYGANWHGTYVRFIENGVYTIYGWFNYVEDIVQFGVQGLAGAAVFYYVWLKVHEHRR